MHIVFNVDGNCGGASPTPTATRDPVSNSYGDTDANTYGYGDHASGIAYAYGNRDGDNYTEACPNAKAAAHAVSTADASVRVVKG